MKSYFKPTYNRIMLISSMMLFGTIGLFRRLIPLPSGYLAMLRGFIGSIFLLFIFFFKKSKPNFNSVNKNLFKLILSGAMIGFNWILLFESYRYTTVATATLCYYMAPIFVLILAPLILKEHLNFKTIICGVIAVIGMGFVSGSDIFLTNNARSVKGILLGLGAALLYASVILINKTFSNINSFEKTFIQLFSAGIVLIPYTLFAEQISSHMFTPLTILLVCIVGIIHTGVAYTLYFASIGRLKATTVAIYSYLDPIVALLISTIILKENMNVLKFIGAFLILGSAFFSELPTIKSKNTVSP